jgi:hypothetical protein
MPILKNNNPFVTVIFSKDRPMQLDLCLTTNEKYCVEKSIRNEVVIYKTSNNRYEECYEKVKQEHPNVQFIKENNFKTDLIETLKKKKYVLFLADDCIFTRKYSIDIISSFLDICDGVLAFSLRLGENTEVCYLIREKNDIPYMQTLGNNISAFSWRQARSGDFSHPLELSGSIYRVKQIKPILESLDYSTPNSLKSLLSNLTASFNNVQFLLCYNTSPVFCNPINRVQVENNNRVGSNPNYSVEKLLDLYEQGFRINDDIFDGMISNGTQMEKGFQFYNISQVVQGDVCEP